MDIQTYTYDGYTIKYVFEPPESEGVENYFCKFRPKEGDVVVDAGAYTGVTFTLLASQMVGPTGIVYSFEPDPFNYGRLMYNLQLNGATNVVLIPKGLWNSNTKLPFYSKHSGASTFFPNYNGPDVECFPVDVMKLDGYLPHIDFLKMDMEGAEIEALEGCQNLLINDKPTAVIETYHIRNGQQTYVPVCRFLGDLGYILSTAQKGPLTVYAHKLNV
jgi:FkbM family methyltransferase